MAWHAIDAKEQRVRFVVAVSRKEEPMSNVCGALWVYRYAE